MAVNGNPPPPTREVANTELNGSLKNVLAMVTKNNQTMTIMNEEVQSVKLDITSIKDVTNKSEWLYATQGKISRLEMKN